MAVAAFLFFFALATTTSVEPSASDQSTATPGRESGIESSWIARYGVAVACVILAGLVRLVLEPFLADRQPYVTFYIAVTVAAWLGGLWPSALAAILGYLFAICFFVASRRQGDLIGVEQVVGSVLYFAVAVAIAVFGAMMHSARRRAVLQAGQALLAESALGESQQRIRAVVDHVVDGLITIDARGIVEAFNPAAERIFGYPASEVIGRNIKMLMPEPYQSEHDEYLAHYLRTGQAKIIGIGREVIGLRKDGATFPMDLAVSEFRVGGQRFFSGIVRDITERKRSEQALRFLAEANAMLLSLVDYESTLQKVAWLSIPSLADWCVVYLGDGEESDRARPVGVAHRDPERVSLLRTLAERACRTPGSPLSVVGTLESGKPELMAEVSSRAWEGTLGVEERETIGRLAPRSILHVPLVTRGRRMGAMTFATSGSRRPYDQADLRLAEELAHRVAAAIENARLYHEVREADRRKDEFLAMLAHELRNPLAAISNGVYLLRNAASPERTEWVQQLIERQTKQLGRLIDDLLDISRISRGKIRLNKREIDLAQVIQASAESVRELMDEKKHNFLLHLADEPLPVRGDPARLQQILVNLLTNAAKYTDEGGCVQLSASRESDQVVVRVKDNGIGIPKDLQPRIFNLFDQVESTLDRSKGGLGIGLTLVQRLAELHDGRVSVCSEGPGQGSEFTLQLPGAQTTSFEPHHARPAAEQQPAAALRILVIEDNHDTAATLAAMLADHGHEVDVARDGYAAIDRVRARRPDVVLMDIGLPRMDGYEVARRLRTEEGLTDALLIAISGYGQLRDRLQSREAGFDHHLLKPVDHERLTSILATYRPRAAQDTTWPVANVRRTRAEKPSYRVLLVDDSEPVARIGREILEAEGHKVIVASNGRTAVQLARAERPQIILCDISLGGGMDGYAVAELLRREQGLSETVMIAVTGHSDPVLQQRSLAAGFDLHLVKPVDFTQLREIVANVSRCAG